MKEDKSEHRNNTKFATSSGLPSLLREDLSTISSIILLGEFFISISVFIGPGEMQFTLMFSFPYSLDNVFDNEIIAAFDDEYADLPGLPSWADEEAINTIFPYFFFIMDFEII